MKKAGDNRLRLVFVAPASRRLSRGHPALGCGRDAHTTAAETAALLGTRLLFDCPASRSQDEVHIPLAVGLYRLINVDGLQRKSSLLTIFGDAFHLSALDPVFARQERGTTF